jgi:predicted  nucleic acid-binding Zn-ribbon protein
MSESELQHLFTQNADQYSKIDRNARDVSDLRSEITRLQASAENIREDFEQYKASLKWIIGLLVSMSSVAIGLFLL